jgi:hypothetical protein
MTVTIRDHAAETAAWGSPGLFTPILRTVTISDHCPTCGGPRGEATKRPFYEDGVTFALDCWKNPCGHIDTYSNVLKEAADAILN